MQKEALQFYVSPTTGAPLELEAVAEVGDEIVEGTLRDTASGAFFPVRDGIPRFVQGENYAGSFGFQWNRYRRVQLDSYNGSTLTRDRFFQGTGWASEELAGKRVLEAGCGAGRFSEIILETGAELFSFDYSSAVDAAWENNRHHPNWHLCQADIYAMPFPPGWFDYVFCYGVLQHTPDPKAAFLNLTRYLKPGGRLAVDIYARETKLTKLAVKYWYRPVTSRLPPHLLMKIFEFYLPFWTPVDSVLQKIPILGTVPAVLIPCWNKSYLPMSPEHRMQWTILDTFDAFSCQFDYPQTLPEVQAWFEEAGLADFQVERGGNGIQGNARRPVAGTERP